MEPLIPAAIVALLVLGLFVLVARFSADNPDIMGRLTRFAGQGEREGKKAEKKQFSLGIGESQIAARVDKAVGQRTVGKTMARKLAQADLKLTLFEFFLLKALAVAMGLSIGLYLGRGGAVQQVIFSIGGVALGFFAPDMFVKYRISRRLKAFNEQLGDTIGLLANSLRSGYSLLQSMELVSRESPDPIGTEFKRVVREVGLGLTPQDALANLLRRMPSDDL
ncbi:MAG TPA: type II secretion system F family protein, partial [Chloroflexia bacterium]|nr:type II secretion system F family protein [Chloroflexia bacterium]